MSNLWIMAVDVTSIVVRMGELENKQDHLNAGLDKDPTCFTENEVWIEVKCKK